jgi:hypothetical protein
MMEGGSQTQWGNQLGYLIFPIPLKHSSDPLDCVRAAKKTGNQMKASLEATFTYWSGALLMSITGPVVRPSSFNLFPLLSVVQWGLYSLLEFREEVNLSI